MASYSIIAMVQKAVSLVLFISRFEPRPIHVVFMGDKLALQQIFFKYFSFLSAVYSLIYQ